MCIYIWVSDILENSEIKKLFVSVVLPVLNYNIHQNAGDYRAKQVNVACCFVSIPMAQVSSKISSANIQNQMWMP